MKNEIEEYYYGIKNIDIFIEKNKDKKDIIGDFVSACFLLVIEAYIR